LIQSLENKNKAGRLSDPYKIMNTNLNKDSNKENYKNSIKK